MGEAQLLAAKRSLRAEMTRRRRAIPEAERAAASAAMCAALVALPQYRAARTVFAYASMPDEVQLDGLLSRALADAKRVVIPWITGRGTMEAVELPSLAVLERGAYGIRNVPERLRRAIAPEEIDLAVVPGAAFTAEGARLGLGGGYYDRYLGVRARGAYRIALAFDALLVSEVPMAAHDISVAEIVTETRHLICRKKR